MITFQDTDDSAPAEKVEASLEVATEITADVPAMTEAVFEMPVTTPPAILEESIPAELQQVSDEVAAAVTASIEAVAAQVVEAPTATAAVSSEAPKANTSAGKAAVEESIRVALPRVENLIDYIGEMAILQNVLKEQLKTNESVIVKKTLSQLGKVSKEIQDLAMSLRMIPLKPTFQKMQRIVRDTAQALKKDVGITLQGEDTELDKTVLERINDPLVHLIRNAVDHGIESGEVRVAKNKAAKGTVTLSASHRAGRLVIEVKDDGGGLDPAKLMKKAIEKGILKPGTVLSDADAYQLIFAPGFSTKELVTDVSGRGVGMDVVRTNIQELGGEVQIESVLGVGTTFRIFLPLTLAIIDAMVVMLNNERFVMPLNHVHETLQPKPELIHTTTNMGDVMVLRGDHLPVYRLGDFFGMRPTISIFEMTALVVRTTKEPFVVLVDSIIGQQQVVIKQLGVELSALKGVSGTTILGDGKPALILEPSELIKKKISRIPYQQGVAA